MLREDYDANQEFGLMELHQLASPFYDFTPNGQNGNLVTKEMLKQKVIEMPAVQES